MKNLDGAIAELDQELEAIYQKASDIERAKGALERLRREGLTTHAAPLDIAAPAPRKYTRRKTNIKKQRAATRTDGRTEQGPRQRSLPDDLQVIADRVVAALRIRNPQRPGDLATAAKLPTDRGTQRRLLIKLGDLGRIVRSGNGRGAMVSLPGSQPAKEGL
jgi:hypothetical protein